MDVAIPVSRTLSTRDEYVVVDLIDIQRTVHVEKKVGEQEAFTLCS